MAHRTFVEPKKRQDHVELEEMICEEVANAVEDLILTMVVTRKVRNEKGKLVTPKVWTGVKTFQLNVGWTNGKAVRITIEPSKF